MPTNIWPALIWPVAGGVGVVTQEFGERPEYYAKLGSPGGHNGRDISVVGYDASHPPALVATIPGECWPYADTNPAGQMQGYGWVVEVWYPSIAHPIVKTIQAHMIGEPVVRRGQLVKPGDVLGYMGSSGNSSGPHVHYSIKPKLHGARNPMFLDWIDPRSFMPR